jgi:hypothetical protein
MDSAADYPGEGADRLDRRVARTPDDERARQENRHEYGQTDLCVSNAFTNIALYTDKTFHAP